MKKDLINIFIKKYNDEEKENVKRKKLAKLISKTKLSHYKIIKSLFYHISTKDLSEKGYIINAINLICFICSYMNFDQDENNKIAENIRILRNKLFEYLNEKHDQSIMIACDKLDEIHITNTTNLLQLIVKKYIDKKEYIYLIKKIIEFDKSQILSQNCDLFDYVFYEELKYINTDSYLNIYYIALLKLLYHSNINKEKYINELNKCNNNEYNREIYNILFGNKHCLTEEEIIFKYDKNIHHASKPINISYGDVINNSNYVFTIDEDNTILKDDAISIRKDGTNYIVSLYISDIPKYIDFNSDNDIVAFNLYRNSSLINSKIHIYPSSISDYISLNKNNARYTLAINFIFDSSFQLKNYSLSKEYIFINDNLSYSYVDDVLQGNYNLQITNQIILLKEISISLNKILSSSFRKKTNLDDYESYHIISVFNSLYNILAATIANEHNYPFIYRAQDPPDVLKSFEDLEIKLTPQERNIIKRIYTKPYYTLYPKEHYGQKIDLISRCTAPLRRFPDGYNQRLIHKYLLKDIDFDDSNIEKHINYFNIREIQTKMFEKEYSKKASLNLTKKNI